MILYSLYRRAAAERNELRRQRDQLVIDLAVERVRSARAAFLAAQPCEVCQCMEMERDDAVAELDTYKKALLWLEGSMGVTAT